MTFWLWKWLPWWRKREEPVHRTCRETPFCRERLGKVPIEWTVESVELRAGNTVAISLASRDASLEVFLQCNASTVKMTIGTEANAAAEVITGWSPAGMRQDGLSFAGGAVTIAVSAAPFRVDIFYESILMFSANAARLLAKDSVDVTLVGAATLMGMPLRAGRAVALEDTGDEPLRCYNADVFGYELDAPHRSLYGCIPHVLSDNRSVLFNNASEAYLDVWTPGEGSRALRWLCERGATEVFLSMAGSLEALQGIYASLTGFPQLPPRWALGYHQSRWNYVSQGDVLQVSAGFDAASIPCDAIWLDIEHTRGKRYMTWDEEAFPDPAAMHRQLKTHGRELVTIIDPHIKVDPQYPLYAELVSRGFAVRAADGRGAFEGDCWPGASVWVDFSNPEARAWWSAKIATLDPPSWPWNDMNEPSVFGAADQSLPKDALHSGNVAHGAVHNLYGHWMHRATWEGLQSRGERPFLLTRSFFTGSQATGWVWAGDSRATWPYLQATVPMLLSLSVAGFGACGADVGGFFGDPDEELLVRWYQAAALQPFFRAHSHLDSRRREPFLFGGAVGKHIAEAIRLRYSLLPYIYTCFFEAHRTGVSLMRPRAGHAASYRLGADLLVQPIVHRGVDRAECNVPAGFYDFFAMRPHRATSVAVDLSTVLLFVRPGAVVPSYDAVRGSSAAMQRDPLTLLVFPDDEGCARGNLFFDDGRSPLADGGFVHVRYEYRSDGARLETVLLEGDPKWIPAIKAVRVAQS